MSVLEKDVRTGKKETFPPSCGRDLTFCPNKTCRISRTETKKNLLGFRNFFFKSKYNKNVNIKILHGYQKCEGTLVLLPATPGHNCQR